MKLRPSFPEIPADNPFANCKLEREPFAKILTSVIFLLVLYLFGDLSLGGSILIASKKLSVHTEKGL